MVDEGNEWEEKGLGIGNYLIIKYSNYTPSGLRDWCSR